MCNELSRGGPTKVDLLHVQRTLARDGLPVRLVHVIPDHRGDDAIPVYHSDVGPVREIQHVVRGNGHSFGIGELRVPGQSTVAAMGFVPGKTTFSRSDHRLPVVVGVRVIVGVADSDNLVGFRVRDVEGTVQWT